MPDGPRRLVAIMFTDMVGFTALAQADEALALKVLERHQQLLRPLFPRFHGREVKTMGDAFLVEFESALDAARCAVEIQRILSEHNAASTDPWKIRLRIGLHLGDVTRADGDVLGDAVNVASRLEPLAEPGGICLSEPVYGQIRNKVPHRFVRLEQPSLKNVDVPLEVYKLVLPWDEAASEPPVTRTSERGHRLAVLPFANMSPDPQDEFFAEGMTEEIITELSRLAGLEVIARTSVMRYKNSTKGVREVGRELRVDVVLEGSVRKAGNRIRVTAQLVSATSESHLWADRFDRDLTDILAVQTEIAQQVASRLGVTLGHRGRTGAAPEKDLDAYFLYLKGRFLWNRRSLPSVQQAMRNFEEVVARAPGFSQAHSGIADCLVILANNFEEVPWAEVGPRARASAARAVELDEGSAEAHASLALVFGVDRAWRASEHEIARALELNERYAVAHTWHSRFLLMAGRIDAGKREIARAAELDPLSPVVLIVAGHLAAFEGRTEEALRIWDSVMEIEPAFAEHLPFVQAVVLDAQGETERALRAVRRMEAVWSSAGGSLEEKFTWEPAAAYAVTGRVDEARASLARLEDVASRTFVGSIGFASVYAALGENDRFFEQIPRALDEHLIDFVSLRLSPLFRKVRDDPRFPEIFRQAGLAPTLEPSSPVAGPSEASR